jgi:hypothetical protein
MRPKLSHERRLAGTLENRSHGLARAGRQPQPACALDVIGTPFSIGPEEVLSHWPGLRRHASVEDIDNAPPKFLDDGLQSMLEVVWISG